MTKPGDFIWYELMTPDADGATAFYEAVLGWTISNPGQDGFDYREIGIDGDLIGGVLAITPDMAAHGAQAGWLGYVEVDDVDAKAAAMTADGGRIYVPPRDIPNVGRFAMLADPQGAMFYIMRRADGIESNAFAAEVAMVGRCAWNELAASDVDAAFGFYGSHFGWVKDGEMDMGPSGTYHFLRHGPMIGGIAPLMPNQPPGWTFYFRVPSIAAAVGTVKAGGGTITMGPHEIPGGDHIIIGTDPQGARFALVGAKG